jgi:hypothetical protein
VENAIAEHVLRATHVCVTAAGAGGEVRITVAVTYHLPMHLFVRVMAASEFVEELCIEERALRVCPVHTHFVVGCTKPVGGPMYLQGRVVHLLDRPEGLPSVAPVLAHEIPRVLHVCVPLLHSL